MSWGLAWVGLLSGCAPSVAPPPDDDDATPDDDDDLANDDDSGDDDSGDDDDSAVLSLRVVARPLPPCLDPVSAPGLFVDGAPNSGVDFVHATDPAFTDDPGNLIEAFADVLSTGLVAADLDADGAVDLFFTQTVGPSRLFWGLGDGGFTPGEGLLPDLLSGLANAADFDADGDLDLLVGGWQHLRLFRHDAGRVFVDVSAQVGLLQPNGWAGGSSWADWDNDGDLDLFAGGYVASVDTNGTSFWEANSSPERLYRNDDGLFVDVTATMNLGGGEDGATLHAVWRDLDDDGDPDLVQVNDFGGLLPNTRLWENGGPDGAGWRWTDRAAAVALPVMGAPMGALVRDLDGDGYDDLWFSDFGDGTILRSLGPFDWVDVSLSWAPTLDLHADDASWSVLDLDLDGDGEPGLFLTMGPIPFVFAQVEPTVANQPDRFLRPASDAEGKFHFRDTPEVFPRPLDGLSRGAAEADLNGDGVPDLVVSHVGRAPSLLLGRCTANHRLAVRLRDPTTANRDALGARVTVTAGGRTHARTVDVSGRGTFSGSDPTLLWGLGAAEEATVTVRWPDGGTDEILVRADLALVLERLPDASPLAE